MVGQRQADAWNPVRNVKQQLTHRAARQWTSGLLLSAMAITLGRANIGHVVWPFGFAFCVVLMELVGRKRSIPALFTLVGAYWSGAWQSTGPLLIAIALYSVIRWSVVRRCSLDLHWLPALAGSVDVVSRLAVVGSVWTRYDVLLAFAEGALVTIFALIVIQCLPMLLGQETTRSYRHEQFISLTILVGAVITGLSGLVIHQVPVVDVVVDVAVLYAAAAGGAGVSTSVAVILGISGILSHSQSFAMIAVLSFAGLMSGLLKEAGRFWQVIAFVLSLGLLAISGGNDWNLVLQEITASMAAAVLFLCTPNRMLRVVASHVPGTHEHRLSEQERVRRVRMLVSEKIQEVGQIFDELSATFADTLDSPATSAQQLLNQVVGETASFVCHGCARRDRCWDREGYQTYQAMVHTVTKIEGAGGNPSVAPTHDLRERCVRIDAMMSSLRHNLEATERDALWMEKMREQRTLVSAQLSGVAGVVRTIASEIDKGTENSLAGEEEVLSALQQLGLYVDHVHIVSLDPGKVEVEITQPSQGAYENSVRVIAPLLSGIVGENITVSQVSERESGPCTSVFSSARLFNVDTAVATLARDGKLVSGDSHTAVDLGNGRYALAVSDGMGNGERAKRESRAAIELLQKLLRTGFDEHLAIKTVNSTLLMRSREEIFTTLDMALIDLFTAQAAFMKIGSAPSFIKRGQEVRAITGDSVPIGILQDIEVQAIEEQLQEGDILILMSDGIYDAADVHVDKEGWLRTQLQRLETSDPQSIADTLIELAARTTHGQINDDMTVMVARVCLYQPEWAAIKLPGVTGIRAEAKAKRRGA